MSNGTARGIEPNAVASFRALVISDHPLLNLLRERIEPITVAAAREHPLPEDLVRLFGMSTLFVIPLVARGALVGAMFVDPPRRDGDANRRLQILSGIAHQAALALQTARLQAEAHERQRLERELDVAQRIQHSSCRSNCRTLRLADRHFIGRRARSAAISTISSRSRAVSGAS